MSVSSITIYEACSCSGSRAEALVEFLRRRYAESKVDLVDLSAAGDTVEMAPALLARLDAAGDRCLPALVVDGVVLAEGTVPNFIDAVTVIDTGIPLAVDACACDPGCCG